MARQHTRKKGKSGSLRPLFANATNDLKVSKKIIEKEIEKLAKQGKSASEIGAILRDSHGVPDVKKILNKKLVTYLKDKGYIKKDEFPEDLKNLLIKAISIHTHIQKNNHDAHNRHNFLLVKSKIKRLIKYYKRKNNIPKDWTFTIENAKLVVGEAKK